MIKSRITAVDALVALYPTVVFSFEEDMITLWESDLPQPSKEELDMKILELEAEYEALQYSRDRKEEYNKLNQDELRFDDMINGTTIWFDTITAIKAKYPKGAI